MSGYVLPFKAIKMDSRVIIYGAGNVGRNFYKQLINTEYAQIVAWVDQKYASSNISEYKISSPEVITSVEYDSIIIAIDNPHISAEVKEYLMNNYSVSEDKIIISDNYRYGDVTEYKTIYDHEEISELERISPKELLCSNRLDLCVRYLLSKDIINGIENKDTLSLYSRMILCRSNASEGEDYYSEYTRNGTEEYINAVKKLCDSMKASGFDDSRFIPIGDNGIWLNGAHRAAAALALEEDIWVRHIQGQNGNTYFGMPWFEENGFNENDKIRILRAYADLYEKCGIMILFGPCMEQWNYLIQQIKKQLNVVGSVELDFSDNYIAFENLIHDIYSDPLWRNVYIDRKLDLLMMSPLKIKVLLISDENDKGKDIYNIISNAKLELRERLYFDTDIAPVVMHGSDSSGEFNHLKRILLSVNNLNHLKMRVTRNYSEEFIERIERCKKVLDEKGIKLEDVFLPGSSSFEIFGLRKAGDIDVVVHSKYREKYGDDTIYGWQSGIDYVRRNSIEISDGVILDDDVILGDDNLHFYFCGLNIVNLELIAKKKAQDKREKDQRDVRLYELFKDYVSSWDNKEKLRMQIENNFRKKR